MAELNLVPIPSIVSVEVESAKYDNGTITNGHGQASGAYVTVQKGTSASIKVDFTITTVSQSDFKQWKSEVSSNFSREESSTLEENWGGGGFAGGFLRGAFGIIFGAGDANHYRNTSSKFHTEADTKKEGFAKSVYNLTTSQFKVTGTLTAVGTSFIPVTASVYVQVTKIRFSDGKEISVINTSSPVAGDKNGSTTGVESKPTELNLISL